MRCECVDCTIIGACYSLSCLHLYKNKRSELYEMGAKVFVLCCYEEIYTPLLFCTRFKQGERVFLPVAAFPGGRCRYEG